MRSRRPRQSQKGYGVQVQHRAGERAFVSPWGRAWHLSDMSESGIFRATGKSTCGADPGDVIRNTLSSIDGEALEAGSKERRNTMNATGVTVAR